MQETKPLPKEVEALIAVAESGNASIRRVIGVAYKMGEFDGMLAMAKLTTKAVERGTEVAA